MTETRPKTNISKDDLDSLKHLSDLLHLFHHRNTNQHRRSIWWRHFSIFRRQMNMLVKDLCAVNEVPASHLERVRKKAADEALRVRISQRCELWQDVLVPKWENSFSQVVADGRFAVLGIVLLAILAQACQVLGITAELEDVGQGEVEKVLEDFGKEYWTSDRGAVNARSEGAEDLGEVVARDEEVGVSDPPSAGDSNPTPNRSSDNRSSTPKNKQSASSNSQPKRKKRKKGDAIDDLFNGL